MRLDMPSAPPIIYCLIFCLALSPAALGADNVLSVIPDDSLGFAVVRRIDKLDEKVAAVAEVMKLPAPRVFELAKLPADVGESLDEGGSLAIAVLPAGDADEMPVLIAIVPTRDYQSFVDALAPEAVDEDIASVQISGKPLVVGEKGTYAILTSAKDRSRLKEVLDSSQDIAKSAGPLESFLAQSDIGIVITTSGVKLAADKGLEGLAIMKAVIEQAGPDAQAALAGLAMYESMFAAMKEGVTHMGLSLRIDTNSNLFVASQVLFGPHTKQGPMPDKAATAPGLAGLPGGPFLFAFHGAMPERSWEGWIKYSIGMSKSFLGGENLTEEQFEELIKLSLQSMKGMRGMSMLMGVGEPGASPYSAMSTLMHVDDADSFIENYSQTITAMSKWGKEANISFYQFKDPEQVKIGDQAGIKVAMDLSNMLGATGQVPHVQQSMKRLFGGEQTLDFYLSAVDQHTVALAYVSKENLLRTMAAATKSAPTLADDASIAETATIIRPDSQWIVYLSPQGAIQFASNMARLFATEDTDVQTPPFAESPPLGISANTSPSKIDVEFVAPVATLEAIGGFIQSIGKRD